MCIREFFYKTNLVIILPILVREIKLSIICENTTFKPNIYGDFGLSILIESQLTNDNIIKVLFDTGMNPKTFEHNVAEMKINLEETSAIIISHGHDDHVGGLLKALELIGKRIPIIMHPDALLPKFYYENSKLSYCGIPFSINQIRNKGILLLSRDPVRIAPGITVTGQIPRITDYERPSGFLTVRGGEIENDALWDDQALLIEMSDGSLGIITGCGHSGIINIINHAIKLTNKREIKFVIGGLHLFDANIDRIDKTWSDLKTFNPKIIAPMHCSGIKIISKILHETPEKFQELHAGDTLSISAETAN